MPQSIDDFLKQGTSNSSSKLQSIDDFIGKTYKNEHESAKKKFGDNLQFTDLSKSTNPVLSNTIKAPQTYDQFKATQDTFGNPDIMQSPTLQNIAKLDNTPPKWNGVLDNPITKTVGKVAGKTLDYGIMKPVDSIYTTIADSLGAINNAIQGSHQGMDGQPVFPSEKRNIGQDIKDIWHNVPRDHSPLEGALPNDFLDNKRLHGTNQTLGSIEDSVLQAAIPLPGGSALKGAKGAVSKAFDSMFKKVKPIETAIQDAKPVLGLPEPKSAIMARELQNRSVLPANTDVIHGQGNVETLGLPESSQYNAIQRIKAQQTLGLPEANPQTVAAFNRRNGNVQPTNTNPIYGHGDVAEPLGLPQGDYVKPTRLKVNNPNETLDYVMTKIKPQVMAIIEAPERRDLLVKYIQKNTGYEMKDIINRPMNELQQLGLVIQNDLHGNMQQIAFDVAKQQGHDLPSLLENQAPSLRGQMAKDAQSRVYGVPAENVNIPRPKFNKEVTGQAAAPKQGLSFKREPKLSEATADVETPLQKQQRYEKQIKDANDRKQISELSKPIIGRAAMPITKIGRPSSLREVAATAEAKPRVSPVNGTVIKKETVTKPMAKVEIVGKTEPLKPKVEVQRTVAPTQRAAGIRANYQNQLKNGNLSPELKDMIKNTDQSYEKFTNQAADNTAKEAVKNLTKAESDFLSNEAGGPAHIATGYRLQQKLDAMGEHDRSLAVSKKLAEDLTKSGQTSQAAAIISRLSPEGQLQNLIRTAQRNGKEVTVSDSVEFKVQAKKAKEKAGAGIQANQFTEILDRAAKGERLTPDDVKKMGDYLANADKNAKPKIVKVTDDLPNELKEPRKRDRIVSYLDDAEQAALARIKARKNNLNSLPIGEWADHAIVAASQITKGSIKAATHVEDLVKLFGEQIRPVATQVFQKAQSLVKSVSPGIGSNDMTKANKAFERISGQVKDMNHQEKIVEKYIKENPKVSPKDIDTLRELAKNVTQLSSKEGVKADIAMQKILNSYEKSNPWDKAQAVRYMAMLLNSGTQLVNAASGPIMATKGAIADVFGTMVDVAMHQTLKTPRSVTMYGTNPLRFMADYFKHLIKTGAPAGWHGVSPGGIQNAGEIRGLTFKSNYNPLNWAERTLGAVAKGADYATYKTIFDSEIRKSGFLDAINSGIKRSDRSAIKAHVEKFVNEPTEAALLDADRIGKNTTFQRSDSTGGKVANFLSSGPAVTKPVVGAILPFVRTPINMASSAVSMTPAGIIKGLYQLTSKSPASQREAIRTLSLGVTGTFGTSALGYYLSQIGVITGANDSGDKNVDAIREQAGKGKYRFNTSGLKRYMSALLDGDGADAAEKAAKYQEGDHAFDYNKFQPIAFPLAIGASLHENKGKSIVGRVGSAGADAYGSLFGMSTLKGVQDVFQPQYTGTQGEKSLGVASRVAESFFKSFSPSMLAQEARRQDPIARKTPYNNGLQEDVKGYFQSRTPGLSQDLPASKTTLGMNKMNAAGFSGQYVNPYKSEIAAYSSAAVIISDLIDKTGDTSLAPSAPAKNVKFKNKAGDDVTVAIPQDRYEQLQEELGHEIILKITAMDPKLSDTKKADKIKDIYAKARKKEMDKVEKELKAAQ